MNFSVEHVQDLHIPWTVDIYRNEETHKNVRLNPDVPGNYNPFRDGYIIRRHMCGRGQRFTFSFTKYQSYTNHSLEPERILVQIEITYQSYNFTVILQHTLCSFVSAEDESTVPPAVALELLEAWSIFFFRIFFMICRLDLSASLSIRFS